MSRENVASHLQKYRMHLKMMGAASNLSPDEMMQLHVNGEIADDRRWNESENRSRWPLSPPGGGGSGRSSPLPPPASVRLWSTASLPLPSSPLSGSNGGGSSSQSLAMPSGIVRSLAAVSASLAAVNGPLVASAQQPAMAAATLGSLLGIPSLGLGSAWSPPAHVAPAVSKQMTVVETATPVSLAAALLAANGALSGGMEGLEWQLERLISSQAATVPRIQSGPPDNGRPATCTSGGPPV